MTELKTLKDINDQIVIFGNPIRCVMTSELREEAIKWVKTLRHPASLDKENTDVVFTGDMLLHDWILKFFNITEKDLK